MTTHSMPINNEMQKNISIPLHSFSGIISECVPILNFPYLDEKGCTHAASFKINLI